MKRKGRKRKGEEKGEGRGFEGFGFVMTRLDLFVVGQFFGTTLVGLVLIGTRLLLLLVTPIDGSGWGWRSILRKRI